VLKLGIRD